MSDLRRLLAFAFLCLAFALTGCPDDDDDSSVTDDDDAATDDDDAATDDDDAATDDDDDSAGDDDDAAEVTTFTWVYDNVVSTNCNCHSGATHSTGFAFNGDQATLYSVWVGVASSELPSMNRVEAGDAANSYVMNKLDGTHEGIGGSGSQMPLSGCCLDEGTRDNIREWINDGAQDN